MERGYEMTIFDRIRERREKLGLTQEDLAKLTGYTSRSMIGKIENGQRDINQSQIAIFAKALQTTPSYLMGWEGKQESIGTPYNPTKRIPVLGRISAGSPLYCEENIVGYTYTDLNGSENEYFALRVSGNSMNASRICDGDLVIVRRQSSVENGQIAVVMVGDDEATIKRFYNGDDHITLMPQSTDQKFLPQIYNPSQTKVTVLGLVVKIEIRV